MRKYSNLMMSGCVLFAVALTISSCKDDDPPVPPTVAFEAKTRTVKESDGAIQVKVVLDKPALEDITITYSFTGTAMEYVAAAGQHSSDYEITSEYKEVTIAKGESEGIIELELYSDTDVEEDETIVLSIDSVDPVDVKANVPDDITITVQQEDGLIVGLIWGETDVAYTDVDMDLMLWAPNTSGTLAPAYRFQGYSGDYPTNIIEATTPNFEVFFLPGVVDDGNYGISATYYAGTKDPMKFRVTYLPIVNGADGTPVVKEGSYTQQNINVWDEEGAPAPLLAGTFKKAGSTFSEFSDLTIPATSSRQPMFEKGSVLRYKPGSQPARTPLTQVLKTK